MRLPPCSTATAVGLGGLGTASRGVGEGRCVVVLAKQRAVRVSAAGLAGRRHGSDACIYVQTAGSRAREQGMGAGRESSAQRGAVHDWGVAAVVGTAALKHLAATCLRWRVASPRQG